MRPTLEALRPEALQPLQPLTQIPGACGSTQNLLRMGKLTPRRSMQNVFEIFLRCSYGVFAKLENQ